MDYKEEDQEDKRYRKESKFGRKEFKKDVQDAVKPLVKKGKVKKAKAQFEKPAQEKKARGRKVYAGWSAAKLRTFLNEKKKALLIKSGFPNATVPRSKDAMISLCVKLKRKKW